MNDIYTTSIIIFIILLLLLLLLVLFVTDYNKPLKGLILSMSQARIFSTYTFFFYLHNDYFIGNQGLSLLNSYHFFNLPLEHWQSGNLILCIVCLFLLKHEFILLECV